MSRLKQRVPVGDHDGRFIKWGNTAEGTVYEGMLLGFRASPKFPDQQLADLATDDGPLTVPCPAILWRKLSLVRVGSECAIEYLGMTESRGGRGCHDFNVYVGDAADAKPAPVRKTPAPATRDDEVPF